MNKIKVFLPSGEAVSYSAAAFQIEWNSDRSTGGILRIFRSDDTTIAVFAPGGWYGVQEFLS